MSLGCRSVILSLCFLALSACESEAAQRERLSELVEVNMATEDDSYMHELSDGELRIVGKILQEKIDDLRGERAENSDLTSRMVAYALEDREKADALTAECVALFGPYDDPANTRLVADCVDRAWNVR